MSLFPSNNDPSIILVDGQSINMIKKGTNKRDVLDELAYENNELQKKIRELEDRLYENDKIVTEQNSSDKKISNEIKKLKTQISEKDKKNIELFNVNRELVEELRISKEEIETKNRQFNSKSLELKKERERNEAFKNRESEERMDEKMGELVQ
jgi:chromosome segregation ATPase